MSEKINQHAEGDTYVIANGGAATIGNADVRRPNDKFEWDDLLLMENSNQKEATYVPPEHEDQKKLDEILARAKKARVGARILAVFDEAA